jgi:hypothetical protein
MSRKSNQTISNVARNPLSVIERTPRKMQQEKLLNDLPKNMVADSVFPINPIKHRNGKEYFLK